MTCPGEDFSSSCQLWWMTGGWRSEAELRTLFNDKGWSKHGEQLSSIGAQIMLKKHWTINTGSSTGKKRGGQLEVRTLSIAIFLIFLIPSWIGIPLMLSAPHGACLSRFRSYLSSLMNPPLEVPNIDLNHYIAQTPSILLLRNAS